MGELLQVEAVTPGERPDVEEVLHAAVRDPENDHRLELLRNHGLWWIRAEDRWVEGKEHWET